MPDEPKRMQLYNVVMHVDDENGRQLRRFLMRHLRAHRQARRSGEYDRTAHEQRVTVRVDDGNGGTAAFELEMGMVKQIHYVLSHNA